MKRERPWLGYIGIVITLLGYFTVTSWFRLGMSFVVLGNLVLVVSWVQHAVKE